MSPDRQWSRRRFLSARGVGAVSGGLFAEVLAERRQPKVDENQLASYWRFSRDAMACEFSVYLPPTCRDALIVAEGGLDEIDRMEDLLSVYRGSSAVSYVNATAADAPVRVDHRVFTVLETAKQLHAATGGAFDAAAGRLIKAWGFFKGDRRVPEAEELREALNRSGMHHVHLDGDQMTVAFDTSGIELNLGSIGKGYAIDRALRLMSEDFGLTSALVQGGSSSVGALGAPAADPRGWLVGIKDPENTKRVVATVRLTDRALGTSGSSNQYFEAGGRRYGHVLDPRSGWPADELASASAIAADGATADALATAFFVMGLDKTRDFCQDHPSVGAVLVFKRSGGDGQPRVVAINLEPNEVNLHPPDNEQGAAIDLT